MSDNETKTARKRVTLTVDSCIFNANTSRYTIKISGCTAIDVNPSENTMEIEIDGHLIEENVVADADRSINATTLKESEIDEVLNQIDAADAQSTKPAKQAMLDALALPNRIGYYLQIYQAFNSAESESDASSVLPNEQLLHKIPLPAMMNDYATFHQKCEVSAGFYEESYFTIIKEYFNNGNNDNDNNNNSDNDALSSFQNVCLLGNCKSISRNCRDRLSSTVTSDEKLYSTHNQNLKTKIQLLDAIHCSVLHRFDTGYKLLVSELPSNEYASAEEEEEEEVEDAEDAHENKENGNSNIKTAVNEATFVDREQIMLDQITSSRVAHYRNARPDYNNSNINTSANPISSKFVTEINVNVHANADQTDSEANANANDNQSKNNQLVDYSFGHSFQYPWTFTHMTVALGDYDCDSFHVRQKYPSLKEEILHNALSVPEIGAYSDTCSKAELWMVTEYVKGLSSGASLVLEHILAVLFYCNFTQLCTAFSRTYRKLSTKESNQALVDRHSEFANFGCYLQQTVGRYGIRIRSSRVRIFYHGISIPMIFEAFYTTFYCPTSTTAALGVALNFAKTGIVLELCASENFSSLMLFPCNILSEFSNEEERLFLGSESNYESMAIVSIRHLSLHHNYKHFIETITLLNQLYAKACCAFRLKKRHRTLLRALIARDWHVPKYVLQLFENVMSNLVEVNIEMWHFNEEFSYYWTSFGAIPNYAFLNVRAVFCEQYTKQEMDANFDKWKISIDRSDEGIDEPEIFVSPIKCLKFDLFGKVFDVRHMAHATKKRVQLKQITIKNLPLTPYVFESIFKHFISADTKCNIPSLEKICLFVRCQYPGQQTIDLSNLDEYDMRFKPHGWQLSQIETAETYSHKVQFSKIPESDNIENDHDH